MLTVHVLGASGYAAAEAIRLLRAHPEVRLGVLESASHAGESIGSHVPSLRTLDRVFDPPGELLRAVRPGETAILGGAHGVAAAAVPALLERGARAIDLSGDFRIAPSIAVYGLAERYRDAIADAQIVANPGCYPTATLLATLPLAPFAPTTIVVDAKSGITGAGRTPATASLFAEVAGDVRAYGLAGHRHEAEILQEWRAAGIGAELVFTPHVVPLARGMLAAVYAIVHGTPDEREIIRKFRQTYAADRSIRILEGAAAPSVAAVCGTVDAEIHVCVRGNAVRVLCAIDNLGRGAAAQAIRNLNIMHGFPEGLGLGDRPTALAG